MFVAFLFATWQPIRPPCTPSAFRLRAPELQEKGPKGALAANKALEMLGKMGLSSVKDLKPGEMPETKEFVSAVKIRHVRAIKQAEGGLVADYMSLPVDQYAIYDARLMRRVLDSDIFEFTVPTMRPKKEVFMPKPKFRVRVKPSAESISLQSVSASLFDGADLPTNMTVAQLANATEQLKSLFNFGLNTTLSWAPTKKWRAPANATDLTCYTSVRLRIRLPPPFTKVPRPLVQGAIGIVMKFVGNAILPRFAALLEVDYFRWCNGTRNLSSGLGSLPIDDDGYLIVPEKELQAFKLQQMRLRSNSSQLVEGEMQLNPGASIASGDGSAGEAGIEQQSLAPLQPPEFDGSEPDGPEGSSKGKKRQSR